MGNKHKNWHKNWQRLPSGRLRHTSGLEFDVSQDDGSIVVIKDTLDAFQDFEIDRGVKLDDLVNRIGRLAKEAQRWIEKIKRVEGDKKPPQGSTSQSTGQDL